VPLTPTSSGGLIVSMSIEMIEIADWSAPCFLHYPEDVEYFGERVLPLVRELEADTEESHDRFTTNV
jgi:hypothetical protein